MLPRHHEPIVAIATAPGRGAVGIVRVSGQDLGALAQGWFGRALVPRRAHYLPFCDASGAVLDQGLALYFPAPHSYTGEDVLELQAHGGPVGLQLLLARCLELAAQIDPGSGKPRLPGLRLAGPGEFSERAFMNDKLDLAQAEAVADLIDASTEAAARSAGRALAGELSRRVQALAAEMVNLRMLVEATLDFPEEEIDFLRQADARGRLTRLRQSLAQVLAHTRQGALLREGLQVVLAGQPNVGKSSLLNALAGAELAIVTDIPGTTRDRIRQTIQIEGVPVHVTDTAGLRQGASDAVERLGIQRSWQAIAEADAVLFLHDLSRRGQPDYESGEAQVAAQLASAHAGSLVHVDNKLDLVADGDAATSNAAMGDSAEVIALSAVTGVGIPALRQALLQRAGWQPGAEGLFIARQRHVQALRRCDAHLLLADELLDGEAALELLAEELRAGHDALGEITGRMQADELLGEIFSRFCIGK